MHVSGHASQEELKLIINLVKPQYFIPIHGEYRQLKLHAELAGAMHGSVGNVLMIESGDILEFDELGARKAGALRSAASASIPIPWAMWWKTWSFAIAVT